MIFFASGKVESQDGLQYLSVARHWYYQRNLFGPEYEYPQKNIHMNMTKRADGRYYSPTGLGYSIAMLPAVAASDLLHKMYHVTPPKHFPLETDFSLLLFASFTNAFFAGILVVTMYSYLREFQVYKRTAFWLSFLTIVGTNLFAYAKNSYAHMMFATFLMLSFFWLKRHSHTRKRRDALLAAAAYGAVVIAYNPTFILALPALGLYYLFLNWRSDNTESVINQVVSLFKPLPMFIIGISPFAIIYFLFNKIRTGTEYNSGYGIPGVHNFLASPKIVFEGLYGLLFSPGRSFFLYSPLLILPIIFWHTIFKKKYRSEIVATVTLSAIFIFFHALQNAGMDWLQWSGESSWGPRYITMLIPFGVILTALVWQNVGKITQRFILLPVMILSILVQSLVVFLPYQIRFHTLPGEILINDIPLRKQELGNFIPRYSPLIMMPRQLALRLYELPATLDHGPYQVKFKDGIDYPFSIGRNQKWRGLHEVGIIEFLLENDVDQLNLELELANIATTQNATYSAELSVSLADQNLGSLTIGPDSWATYSAQLANIQAGRHEFELSKTYIGTSSAENALFIRGMKINDTPISLKTLDIPYVQPLAQAMTGVEYRYFGEIETYPWFFWSAHTALYEGTLDIWWIRRLYRWDLPQWLFDGILVVNTGVFLTSVVYLREWLNSADNKENTH